MKSENEKRAWVDVYVAPLSESDVTYPIFPRERELEIEGISSDIIRREKYHAWRLLEYALNTSLGLSLAEAAPYRHTTGKWLSDRAELSIAHGGGAVAVAVSRYPVGLDIERGDRDLDRGFVRRMMTAREGELIASGEASALEVWCKKEALFKRRCESRFIPRVTETVGEPIPIYEVTVGEIPYLLAVAAGEGAEVRIVLCDSLR